MSDHNTAIESAMRAAGFDPRNPAARKSAEDFVAAYLSEFEPTEEMIKAADIAGAKAWHTGERMAAAMLKAGIRSAIAVPHAEGGGDTSVDLPQDVINLVIAAREAFDTGALPDDENLELDKALEPFSSRVPYENEPDVWP